MITKKQLSTTIVENLLLSHNHDYSSKRYSKISEFNLYHYTVGSKVGDILKSGFLKPSDGLLLSGEKPVLWFSKNPRFEYTSLKMIRNKENGEFINNTFEIQHELFQNVRFVVNCNPKDYRNEFMMREWTEINHLSNTPSFLKKSLEKSGRRMGGNPIDWCGTLNEIPLKRLKFQVWNSNNQEWVDQDIKSWLNPETTSNKVVKLKVTIKETMKSLLSQFTSNN
jgi:hypothetical protein